MNNLIYELSLKSDFTRIGKKIGEFFDNYTDNVWAGTIIFIVLIILSFSYINRKH